MQSIGNYLMYPSEELMYCKQFLILPCWELTPQLFEGRYLGMIPQIHTLLKMLVGWFHSPQEVGTNGGATHGPSGNCPQKGDSSANKTPSIVQIRMSVSANSMSKFLFTFLLWDASTLPHAAIYSKVKQLEGAAIVCAGLFWTLSLLNWDRNKPHLSVSISQFRYFSTVAKWTNMQCL